jgi:hypothetical protein
MGLHGLFLSRVALPLFYIFWKIFLFTQQRLDQFWGPPSLLLGSFSPEEVIVFNTTEIMLERLSPLLNANEHKGRPAIEVPRQSTSQVAPTVTVVCCC